MFLLANSKKRNTTIYNGVSRIIYSGFTLFASFTYYALLTIIIHKGEIENVNPRYKLGSILVIYYALHIKQY